MLRVHCVVLRQRLCCVSGLVVSLCFGGHSVRETPGYISNPEAKPYSADGTAGGTLWESRTPPNNFWENPRALGTGVFCVQGTCGKASKVPGLQRFQGFSDRRPSDAVL